MWYNKLQELIKQRVIEYGHIREEGAKLRQQEMEAERIKEKKKRQAATRKIMQFRDRVSQELELHSGGYKGA